MRLCRRNNPNTYFTTIDKAFIPTYQARELLKVAHNGIEPCDLMYNIQYTTKENIDTLDQRKLNQKYRKINQKHD